MKGSIHPYSEEGSTLIEVLVSITILAILTVTMTMAFTGGVRGLTKIPARSKENKKILMLEHSLRTYCGRVHFPFWLNTFEPLSKKDIKFPYYLGFEHFSLEIEEEDDMVVIRTKKDDSLFYLADVAEDLPPLDDYREDELSFGPFYDIDIGYTMDDDDFINGVTVTIQAERDRYEEVEIFARIGGEAFWQE